MTLLQQEHSPPLSSSPATSPTGLAGGKRATRLAFFIAGFSISCWAPLVPFAQARLHADAATLGTILLCLGLGAVLGMPASATLCGRVGARRVIIGGAIGLTLVLPLLALVDSAFGLGACLLVFGASIGAIDVAANIHGTDVQDAAGEPLMSGFHGLYSVGGLVGASAMTAAIAAGLPVFAAAALAAAVILACIVAAAPGFFANKAAASHPLFVVPRGSVLVIGLLAMVVFLAEGAMLDWGALLLTQVKGVEVALSGAGYALFALAMTLVRLVGDRIVARTGERAMLVGGILLTAVGMAITALAEPFILVVLGIAIAGLAVGNVVPVLFTLAGRQRAMPASHAIAAASILGYLGVLVGPALVGYVAHFIGLGPAFCALAALLLVSLAGVAAIPFGARAER